MTEDKHEVPAETEETQAVETEDNQARESKPRGAGLASAIAVLALLLAIAAGGGVYWVWLQGQQQSTALDVKFAGTRSEIASASSQLDGRINELLAAQTKFAEAQRNLEQSLSGLHEELGRDRNAWAIAETVYFLQLANARLQLLQDVDTALEALNIADKRLQALGDPGFIPVREKLKMEITALQAVAQTDLTGTALNIGALVAQIPNLPFHALSTRAQQEVDAAAEMAEEQPAWRQELNKAWLVMKQLVEVRRTDKRIEPLLKPEEQHLLVQNIQLQLQTARIAVMQRDSRLYKDSLETAAQWINNAYDLDADITRSTLEQIKVLAAIELSPQLPDISASLRLLRKMSDDRVKTTTEGAAS